MKFQTFSPEMDNPNPPPLPHATTTIPGYSATATNDHALENLKSLLVKCAIASTPAKSLTLPQKTFIENRIQDFLPAIHTPDHPPYAWMIENAIKQLNEEGGSTEEEISKFIVEEYKDLPWAHAALLKHHLTKLSETGYLVESHDGCYLIGKASASRSRSSKPSLTFTCTTSRSPSPSPSLSLSTSSSSSPTASSSTSPTYASSSTSSSSQRFGLKGKGRKKRNYKRKRSRGRMQKARGILIHNEGRGRGGGRGRGRGRGSCRAQGRDRGRGRGQDRGRESSYGNPCQENTPKEFSVSQIEEEVCVHSKEATDIQYLMQEDEAADENIQGQEQLQKQGIQDYVNVESQAQQSRIIDIESPEHEYRVNEERIESLQQDTGDNCSTPRTNPWSHRRRLISEQGSKRVGQRKRNIHSRNTPCKRDMQMREDQHYRCRVEAFLMNDDNMANMTEGEIQYVDQVEQDEGDSLDELIEEVYMELKEATETHLTLDDEAAEGNLQRKEHHQVQGDQDSVNVEFQAEPSTLVPEIGSQQEHIVSEEIIEAEQENLAAGDNSSRPSTTPWSHGDKLISEQGLEQGSQKVRLQKRSIRSKHTLPTRRGRGRGRPCKKDMQLEVTGHVMEPHRDKLINEQGQEQGSKKVRLQKRSILSKHTPSPRRGRGRGRPRKKDMQMEVTGHIMEPPELTEIGDLMTEKEQVTGEQDLSNKCQSEQIEIRDHTIGMQSKNQQSVADQTCITNDVEPQEQEYEFTHNLNEQKLQECNFTKVVMEQEHPEEDQHSWTEEQNHSQIPVQDYKGATDGQIQLEENNDEGVKGQSLAAQIQDEISEKTLMDQIIERSNVDLHKQEYQVDVNLDEQQLQGNECRGNPTVKEVTEKQFQPQTCQAGLTLVLSEPQKQEPNSNEQQDRLKGGEVEILEQSNIFLGDCPWIQEENHIKKASEVLEERNQQFDLPEVITEKNQLEEPCFLVDVAGKENEVFELCDKLKKLEVGKSERLYPSGETKADMNTHKQHNEDQNHHLEQPKELFSEQPVEIAEHDEPIKESNRMGTENVGAIIEGKEMSQHLKQTLLEPQCRKLRPRPAKSQPYHKAEQSDFPSIEKSSETNQCSKLRPRPSRNKSTDAANGSQSLAARPQLQKRQEFGARRSLRP